MFPNICTHKHVIVLHMHQKTSVYETKTCTIGASHRSKPIQHWTLKNLSHKLVLLVFLFTSLGNFVSKLELYVFVLTL